MPEQAETGAEEPQQSRATLEQLRGPDLLSPSDSASLVARGAGRLVIWAGEKRSGKTTLSTQIYERHRDGRAVTQFAGSETLLGFEERMHPSRAASGLIVPYTQRTNLDPDGRDLLHLAIRNPHSEVTDLLIADLPGELFRQLRDSDRHLDSMPILSRADKFVVLVDGEKLADGRRATAFSFARQLIENLQRDGLPAQEMDLLLLTTKLDKLRAAGEAAIAYWDPREAQLLAELRELSQNANSLRVAARGLPDGSDGMEDLVSWLTSQVPEPRESLAGESHPVARIQRIRSPRRSA